MHVYCRIFVTAVFAAAFRKNVLPHHQIIPVSHGILMPTGGCCTLQEDSHMLRRIHKCLGGFTNVWADYEKADFSENNVIMLCSDIK